MTYPFANFENKLIILLDSFHHILVALVLLNQRLDGG